MERRAQILFIVRIGARIGSRWSDVGCGIELNDQLSGRAEALRSASDVRYGIASGRIVDGEINDWKSGALVKETICQVAACGSAGEISSGFRGTGGLCGMETSRDLPVPLFRSEDEKLVLLNGSANRAAKVVPAQFWNAQFG